MNAKALLIHARNQMRTVWLMTSYRFNSPYDIQAHNPALTLSLIALLLGYAITGVYDFLYYPRDLIEGYITDGVSRMEYVLVFAVSYLSGVFLNYGLLFLLAMPLGFAKRYWHGIIAFNWWTLMVTFAFIPVLLFLMLLDDNDPFMSPAVVLLLVAILIVFWKSINLTRHALKTGMLLAVVLTALGAGIQIVTMVVVKESFGISTFQAETPNQSSMNLR